VLCLGEETVVSGLISDNIERCVSFQMASIFSDPCEIRRGLIIDRYRVPASDNRMMWERGVMDTGPLGCLFWKLGIGLDLIFRLNLGASSSEAA